MKRLLFFLCALAINGTLVEQARAIPLTITEANRYVSASVGTGLEVEEEILTLTIVDGLPNETLAASVSIPDRVLPVAEAHLTSSVSIGDELNVSVNSAVFRTPSLGDEYSALLSRATFELEFQLEKACQYTFEDLIGTPALDLYLRNTATNENVCLVDQYGFIDGSLEGVLLSGTYTLFSGVRTYLDAEMDIFLFDFNVTEAAPVPEPASMLLLATGLIGLAATPLKKKFKN